MIFRRTASLSFDDLDLQGCAEDGTPDWDSLVVVGPMKQRDGRGNTTLQWTVTVQCRRDATRGHSPEPLQTAHEPHGDHVV